jgi:CubicO group peptidase (beta-lactamase class C family)
MRSLVLVLALCAAPAPARAAEFDPKPIAAAVEKMLDATGAPGCAVAVVRDGEVVYLQGFGVREKGKPEKVTPDTVFPIASCSKAFTATALAALADDGKLRWDDKVRDHLDSFRLADELADRDVTVRDLLCHRTGMPRHDVLWAGRDTDTAEVIRRWGQARPSTSFRSKWEYANVPFTAAGVVAGRLDGSDWAGAVKTRILQPLGMDHSSCTWKEGTAAPDHATPHYYGLDGSVSPIEWDRIDHAGGAGCVNSTARDMAAWLRFQLAGGKFDGRRLLRERTLKETHTPQMLLIPDGPFAVYFPPHVTRFASYGLGWFVHDYRGVTCVSHGGTLTGFRAQCVLVPEKKVGVVVLCNLRPSFVCEAVSKAALDALLGLPAEDWCAFHQARLKEADERVAEGRKKRAADRKPDTKPSLPPAGYAGEYAEPAYGRAAVAAEDGALVVRWGKLVFRLEHHHFDTFTAVLTEPKGEAVASDRGTAEVLFRLGADGAVEGMKFLDQEFKRAKK